MTFYDPINGCKISSTCAMFDHDLHNQEGELYHDTPHGFMDEIRRHKRRYYVGKLLFCRRAGCDFEEFDGDRSPFKVHIMIGDVEYTMEEYDELIIRRRQAREDERGRRKGDTGDGRQEGRADPQVQPEDVKLE